ncbi:MAG TPA: hypothetical protein VFN77_09900 [Acetobacteraceae bacterium]|nr:hypothetical protein [Acetobacteraceae bacterium]
MRRLGLVLLLSIGMTPAYAQVTISQRALEQLGGAPVKSAKPPLAKPRRIIRRRVTVHVALPKPPPEVRPPAPVVAAARIPPPPRAVPPRPQPPRSLTLIFPGETAALPPGAGETLRKLADAPGGTARRYDIAAAAPGIPGDLSVARRLSLNRGLAVRAILRKAGVPPSHIILRAMGSVPHADDRVTVTQMP